MEPLKVRLATGEIRMLVPGRPVEFSEADGLKLLTRAKGKVRLVTISEEVVIDPAADNARPVYWERADLSIVGPGQPEFLAKVGTGPTATYWVVALYDGQPVWISSIQLRSKAQFEQQVRPRVVELVKDLDRAKR